MVRKSPENYFGLVIIKTSKRNHHINLTTILYVTKLTKQIIQTAIKSYKQFISVRTEALR